MKAASAISTNPDWEQSLREVLDAITPQLTGVVADLALVFINPAFAPHFKTILKRLHEETQVKLLAGCSGQGVIGSGVEIEGQPAISALVLSLPDAKLSPFRFTQELLDEANGPVYWHLEADILPDDANAWLLFADPFHLDCERLVNELNTAFPSKPVVGGLASGTGQTAWIFLNEEVYDDGAIGIAIGGDVTLRAIVSQGCTPIGEPWTITKADRNIIHEIGSQPAFYVLAKTLQSLPTTLQKRVQHNLFVGLVANEYQDEYRRGDFLIRHIVAVDPKSNVIAIGALARVGQTIQFQLRDAEAADEEIRHLLRKENCGLLHSPVAGLLCCCNGRGKNLFKAPHHDATVVREELGALPLTGFFCNGEIGPIGDKNFLHGFTASLGLFTKIKKSNPQ